jgi:hypothetical protein
MAQVPGVEASPVTVFAADFTASTLAVVRTASVTMRLTQTGPCGSRRRCAGCCTAEPGRVQVSSAGAVQGKGKEGKASKAGACPFPLVMAPAHNGIIPRTRQVSVGRDGRCRASAFDERIFFPHCVHFSSARTPPWEPIGRKEPQ